MFGTSLVGGMSEKAGKRSCERATKYLVEKVSVTSENWVAVTFRLGIEFRGKLR